MALPLTFPSPHLKVNIGTSEFFTSNAWSWRLASSRLMRLTAPRKFRWCGCSFSKNALVMWSSGEMLMVGLCEMQWFELRCILGVGARSFQLIRKWMEMTQQSEREWVELCRTNGQLQHQNYLSTNLSLFWKRSCKLSFSLRPPVCTTCRFYFCQLPS